jgi:hypothetical protein
MKRIRMNGVVHIRSAESRPAAYPPSRDSVAADRLVADLSKRKGVDDPMNDPAECLREAWAELRTLPLGGRGHLADACLAGAAEITRLREAADEAIRALEGVPGERVAAQLLEVRITLQAALNAR